MKIQQKRDFLVTFAYWVIIAAAVYLAFEYLLPISVPFILGILTAYLVIRISRKLHCSNRFLRLGLTIMIYGIIGLLITLLIVRGVTTITNIVKWLPEVYEMKLLPFGVLIYDWCVQSIQLLDPALISALEMLPMDAV